MSSDRSIGSEPVAATTIAAASNVSRCASVSNLADRERLDTSGPLFGGQLRGAALPEELQTRGGWTLVTEPHLSEFTTAVIEDNYNRMEEFVPLLRELIDRLSGFKIELTTRSSVKVSCRSMFLGHLLCLCASPRVLQLLQTRNILSTGLFAKKVNLTIDFAPNCRFAEDSVFAPEQRKFAWRSVPSFFMVILRDSFDSFDWLIRQGYLRKLTDTDEDGRNILHASIEMESPFVLTNLLTKDSLNSATLQTLLRQRERSPTRPTPLLKACESETTAMLLVLLQSLPEPFLTGELDASGVSENVICAVISRVKDAAVSSDLVAFLLRRGATPDKSYFDKRCCLDVLICSEHFSGNELCRLVQRLVAAKARVDLGVMITCLSCTVRTDQEILEIACELLSAAGAGALCDAHQSELRELGEESLDMDSNVVVQMLRNPQVSPATVQTLLKHFARYISISAVFPTVTQLAVALVQGVSAELRCLPTNDDIPVATLSPDSLGQVLESLSSFAATASSDSIRRQRYKDSLFHHMMNQLFRETSLENSALPKDKLTKLLPRYLKVMEEAQLDMNAVVDGKVPMFAAFEPASPGWLSLSLLRKIPASFRLNVRDKRGNNLAVVLMRTFDQRYKMLLAGLRTLAGRGFNLRSQVLGRSSLIMAFAEICGAGLKALEAQNALDEERVHQFMEVFRFLVTEGVSVDHSYSHKDVDDHLVTVNALSISLSLGVSVLSLELLRYYPQLLPRVHPSTVLRSLQKFPELLELLNSRTPLQPPPLVNGAAAAAAAICSNDATSLSARNLNTQHVPTAEIKSPTNLQQHQEHQLQLEYTIRHTWLLYVQRQHNELLKQAVEDDAALDTLVLVYDYFQTCEILQPPVEVETEGEEPARPSRSRQRKRKQCVTGVHAEQGIFRDPWELQDRMHSRLLRTIASNATLKSHPMVTEYFQRFYVKAFFMAVLMNLFHFGYLVLLVGHLSWVTTNPTAEANHFSGFHLLRNVATAKRITGYFSCPFARCGGGDGSGFFVLAMGDCQPLNDTCEACPGRVLASANCIDPTTAVFSRCPVHDSGEGWMWVTPIQYFLLVFSAVSFAKETFQLVTNVRSYGSDWMLNAVELIMYTLIFLASLNVSECPWSSGFRESWQYNVSVAAAFLAWSMMFYYLSRFQAFSTYVMMFYTAVKTGVGVLVAFLCFIMGFVHVFHMLLRNQYNFRDLWVSFLKTFDMMFGGLDYNEIFSSVYSKDDGSINLVDQKRVYDDIYTRVVYFIFIVTMPIVLMNLFIGLIVGDVQQINEDAEVKTWTNCVAFIDVTYDMLRWPISLKRKFRQGCQDSRGRRAEAAGRGAGGLQELADQMERDRRYIKLRSISKNSLVTTLLGLVSGSQLERRLLACEKRKLRVKILAKDLHSRLPFLYTVYDPQVAGADGFDLDDYGNGDLDGGQRHNHHNHGEQTQLDGNGTDPLRRLAIPEDVQADDPFLRRRRDAVFFPNKLTRLRAKSMDAVSETDEAEATTET